jgi:hypothetical protein
MQYMCLIYDDENLFGGLSEDERNTAFAEYGTFTESIKTSSNYVAGDALQPTSTATTVRIRNGETLVTDGPFAETKEQLGRWYRLSSRAWTRTGDLLGAIYARQQQRAGMDAAFWPLAASVPVSQGWCLPMLTKIGAAAPA